MSKEIVNLTIDGRPGQAKRGQKVLFTALDAGIHIPNLCAIRDARPHTGCRLCFVEMEGRSKPVTACTEEVAEGMVVRTDTERVRRLQRTALELILASHPVDCANCPSNGNCDLQRNAAFLKVKLKPRRFRTKYRNLPIDDSHPNIMLNPNKCIVCGKCIWACLEQRGIGALNYAFRGDRTVVIPFEGDRLADTDCDGCGLCADICPVAAIVRKQPPSK